MRTLNLNSGIVNTQDRILSITVVRVLGMFSIIGCHFFGYLNIPSLQQFLSVGVYIFLVISGYLYGNKEIKDYKKWYFARIKKVLVPYYVFVIPIIIVYYCYNNVDIVEIVKYLLCLQGINFLQNFIPFTEIPPLGYLWFITIIMLCYLIMIPIKKYEHKHSPNAVKVTLILCIIFSVPLVLSFYKLPTIYTSYFVVFFVGYYLSKFKININVFVFTVFGVLMFIVAIIIRLVSKQFFDENYQSIYQCIVAITHPLTAISIYFIFDYLTNKLRFVKLLANSRLLLTIDKYSYYIYITHCLYLYCMHYVFAITFPLVLFVMLFVIYSIISALVLYHICNAINKMIK